MTYDFRVLNDLLIEEHSVSIEKIPIEDNLETSYILVLFPSKTAAAMKHTRDMKVWPPRSPFAIALELLQNNPRLQSFDSAFDKFTPRRGRRKEVEN